MATIAGNEHYDSTSDARSDYVAPCGDASMEPRIRCGELVLVEPARGVVPGDEVLVELVDGKTIVRELLCREDGRVRLGSVNRIFPILTLDEQEIHAMHYISGIFVRRRDRAAGGC